MYRQSETIPPIDVNERVNKDYSLLVKPWTLPEAKKICLYNGNLIDTMTGTTLPNVNVYIARGKIIQIAKCTSKSIVEAFKVIDCTGKFISPGLVDNHVHITSVQGETDLTRLMTLPKNTAMMRVAFNARQMLLRGFTTVRDCAGAEHYIRDAIDLGVFPGPRLIILGQALSQTGGHGDMRPGDLPGDSEPQCTCHTNNIGAVCDGVPECYKAAREQLRRGANFIKIMGGGGVASPTDRITNLQFTEEEIQAIVKVCDSYGTYATAHCYTPLAIKHCILNGVKGIEHGNLIDDETARLMADLGCYLTPTLITYKIMASDQFAAFLTPEAKVKNIQVLQDGLKAVLIAKRNGVKICHGSDLLGALNGYQTQEFFVRSKILSLHEILKSATVIPMEYNGLQDQFGQVKAGFYADLLVLEQNPLENIVSLDEPETNIKVIIKDGLVYKNEINSFTDVAI